jgi:hypothetical protein
MTLALREALGEVNIPVAIELISTGNLLPLLLCVDSFISFGVDKGELPRESVLFLS